MRAGLVVEFIVASVLVAAGVMALAVTAFGAGAVCVLLAGALYLHTYRSLD